MGKGDKKTRRGKIVRGTYGVRRLRKTKKIYIPTAKASDANNEIASNTSEEKKVKTKKAITTETEVKTVKKETTTEKKASTKKSTKTKNKE